MRLIDDLRNQQRVRRPWCVIPQMGPEWEKYARTLFSILGEDIPVLLIENVAEYYYVGNSRENWNLERDFPNLAPPFKTCWFEFRMPKRIRSDECGDSDVSAMLGPKPRVGVWLQGAEPEDVTATGMPEAVRWVLIGDIFLDYGFGEIVGPHGCMFLPVDAEGRALEAPAVMAYTGNAHADTMKNLLTLYNPVFLALSFLHCKNVAIQEHAPDAALRRKFRAKHGRDPVPHKTLVIEPLKQILRTEGRADSEGLQRAMHICRGHFADYRNSERGLFGKYKKLVWIPQTLKGSKGERPAPREIEVRI